MLEIEAASFIPYLIIKIYDPKNAVRNSFIQANNFRISHEQIILIRNGEREQRFEIEKCLTSNRMSGSIKITNWSLIENYGVSVCQSTLSAALKEVAKQIANCRS